MFYKLARFVVNVYISIYFRFSVTGEENIPIEGAFVLCSNHIHWADPIILACRGTKRVVHFLGKKELFKVGFFSIVLKHLNVIPIGRGEGDVHAIKTALRVLKNNEALGIFPEGTRVKEGEEKKPEGGTALLAIKAQVPIIPVGLSGSYKFRSLIKVNIGKPIYFTEHYKKRMNKEELEMISLSIMKEIKTLNQ